MATIAIRVKAMLNGLSNDIPSGVTALQGNGQSISVKTAIATLTAYQTALEASASEKVQYHNAVAAAAQQLPQVQSLLINLAEALRAQFGKGSPVLAQFGLSSKAPKTPSTATKAAAAGKRSAKAAAKKAALSAVDEPTLTVTEPPAVK